MQKANFPELIVSADFQDDTAVKIFLTILSKISYFHKVSVWKLSLQYKALVWRWRSACKIILTRLLLYPACQHWSLFLFLHSHWFLKWNFSTELVKFLFSVTTVAVTANLKDVIWLKPFFIWFYFYLISFLFDSNHLQTNYISCASFARKINKINLKTFSIVLSCALKFKKLLF